MKLDFDNLLKITRKPGLSLAILNHTTRKENQDNKLSHGEMF